MTIKITPVDAKTAGNDKNTDTQTDKKELPAGEFLVKDSKGRSIILRRPSPRTDIYFPTLFSTAESSNPSFMMEVKLYAFVKSVAGVETGPLDKKTDLDFLIDNLGYEGRKALQLGYAKHFAKEDLKEQEEINEEIKKLL